MNASERLAAIEPALDGLGGDDEIFRNILSIMLNGLKVNHVRVETTHAGHAKTNIQVTLDGVTFMARHFVYKNENSTIDVQEDYGKRIMKIRPR